MPPERSLEDMTLFCGRSQASAHPFPVGLRMLSTAGSLQDMVLVYGTGQAGAHLFPASLPLPAASLSFDVAICASELT